MGVVEGLKQVVLGGLLSVTAVICNCIQVFLAWPIALVSPELFHQVEMMLGSTFITSMILVFRYLGGIKMVFVADTKEEVQSILGRKLKDYFYPEVEKCNLPYDLNNLIITCNHISFVDFWVMYWTSFRAGLQHIMRYVAKSSIKFVPGFGIATYIHGSLFLKRDWKQDKDHINQYFQKYTKAKSPKDTWLLLFPEGTFVNTGEQYIYEACKKHMTEVLKVKPFEYVLYPRSRGFEGIISNLKNSRIKYLMDATIIYEHSDGTNTALPLSLQDTQRKIPDTLSLLSNPLRSIYVVFKLHKIDEIEDSKKWLHESFTKKEEILRSYHETQKFGKMYVEEDKAVPLPRHYLWAFCWFALSLSVTAYVTFKFHFDFSRIDHSSCDVVSIQLIFNQVKSN
jgi:1-acyl-sn-glycerol-3-phosphate acyltransferase